MWARCRGRSRPIDRMDWAPRAVGRAHERTGQHAEESDPLRLRLEREELLRLDPAGDRQVPRGRSKVLRDGDDVRARLAEVPKRLRDLLRLLAHAENEVGLRDQTGTVCPREHAERPLVAEGRTDALEDARHRLDVVGEHLGAAREDLVQLVGIPVEVGGEDLDAGARIPLVDGSDRLRMQPRTTIGQVVAGDPRHGRVSEVHPRDALGHAPRFIRVVVGGLAGVDLAEVAAPRALRSADEEGRLAVFPAFVDVGATGFLADRVQAFSFDQALELGVFRTHLGFGLDPVGFAFDRGFRIANFEPKQLPSGRCERGVGGMAGGVRSVGGCSRCHSHLVDATRRTSSS